MKRSIFVLFVVVGLVAVAGGAMAATSTQGLNATANVVGTCTMSAATDVAFGTYDPTSGTDNTVGDGTMTFNCTKGTAYNTYVTGTRTMSNGTDSLNFTLWADSARTATSYPSASVGIAGTAANTTPIGLHMYGKIAAGQNVGVGSYTAALVATVEY